MTSVERHEARFQRRKAKRDLKKQELSNKYGCFEDIIDGDALWDAFYQCKHSVAWKASTQKYELNLLYNIYTTREALFNKEDITKGFYCFSINERGKERFIRSIHISERVVQKSLVRNCLIPILSRSLIYDNGGCLKGKGISFAQQRFSHHLHQFYRQHNREGYILLIDFSKYFDNILHQPIYDDLNTKILDPLTLNLIKQFVEPFGKKGLGLGSEISQILAINYANKIDHYIREQLHIGLSGRYMDDIYIIHESKEYLHFCLKEIEKICNDLGIKINTNKTQIVKLTHQFTYLKTRYNLTTTGKLIKRPCKQNITRMRRKLKKLRKLYNQGDVRFKDIESCYYSWIGYLKHKNSHRTVRSLEALFQQLFSQEIHLAFACRQRKLKYSVINL